MNLLIDTPELVRIFKEADQADSLMFSALYPAGEEEKVIANLCDKDDDLKKLYGLSMFYKREAERTAVNFKYESEEKEAEKIRYEYTQLKYKADFLGTTFWFMLRTRYELWGHAVIGLRKGWSIVHAGCELGNILGDI